GGVPDRQLGLLIDRRELLGLDAPLHRVNVGLRDLGRGPEALVRNRRRPLIHRALLARPRRRAPPAVSHAVAPRRVRPWTAARAGRTRGRRPRPPLCSSPRARRETAATTAG